MTLPSCRNSTVQRSYSTTEPYFGGHLHLDHLTSLTSTLLVARRRTLLPTHRVLSAEDTTHHGSLLGES